MILPDLTTPYDLSPASIAEFRRDGHVFLPGVVSPAEMAAYRPAINAAAGQFNAETRPLSERDTYGKAFLQIGNLWEKDAAVRRFTLARRFAKIAAELMGVSGVRLYHDQALFKEPGGGLTPWHQDQSYWPLDTTQTITMWMPLVPIAPEVGTMTFASGSHELGELRPMTDDAPISDDSEREFGQIVEQRGLQTVNYRQMNAGDATWHYGWTLHSAPGNPIEQMREVMTIIYFADEVKASQPAHRFHQDDLKKWLPGIAPGEAAASELNPLVYG